MCTRTQRMNEMRGANLRRDTNRKASRGLITTLTVDCAQLRLARSTQIAHRPLTVRRHAGLLLHHVAGGPG